MSGPLRNLDPANQKDYKVLRCFGMISLQPHWPDIRKYLEEELHKLDVRNRTAPPIASTRLGGQAEMLQSILDKFNGSLNRLGDGKVG